MNDNRSRPFRFSFRPIFRLLAAFVTKGWPYIVVGSVLLTIFSIRFALMLELDTNVMDLLPKNDSAVKDFFQTSRLFGFGDRLLAVIELDERLSDDLAKDFMQRFTELLHQSPMIENVEYKLPTFALKEKERKIEEKFDINYVYYTTAEKNMYLMIIYPVVPSGDVAASEKLMAEVGRLEYEAKRRVEGNITGLKVSYTGGHAIGLEESKCFARNLRVTVLSTLGCVMFLFFLAFRRMRIVLSVGITLGMAVAWTLMIAYFTYGRLNVMTVGFAAILAGLGVDFGIHISNRFLHELSKSTDPFAAVRNTIATTGEAICFGCATTSLAFYSLLLTNFSGASEFGFLMGTGVLLCAVAMIITLPAILLACSMVAGGMENTPLGFTGLGHLGRTAGTWGKPVAVVLLLLILGWTALTLWGRRLPEFDNRMDNMSSRNNPAVALQKKVAKLLGNYLEPVAIVSRNADPEAAIHNLRAVVPRINELSDEGQLVRFASVFKHLPSSEKRNSLLERMRKLRNPGKAMDYIINRMRRAGKKEEFDFLSRAKEPILKILESDISEESISFEDLQRILPDEIFRKFFARDPKTGEYVAVCYLYPVKRIIEEEDVKKLAWQLRVDGQKLKMVGLGLMTGRLERMIQKEFKLVTVCIGLALFAFLGLLYRRLGMTIISMIPLVLSLLATISFMIFFKIDFNYVNVVAFPLIIGIGIDDSIHMVYRYYEGGERNVAVMLEQTGRAVLLTSLTTISGFGSLLFTEHTGLMSLGLITSLGIFFCLITSMFILPGLMLFWEHKRTDERF